MEIPTSQLYISRSRTLVMGIAILMVMYFHFPHAIPPILSLAKRCGYWGVDIFFFVSGYGIYYSLGNECNSCWNFYKRRLLRILPSAMLAGWLFYHPSTGTLLGLHLWYIKGILIVYLFSPFLYKLIRHISMKWLVALGIVWMLIYLSLYDCAFKESLATYLTLPRLPAFMAGMALAAGKWNPEITRKYTALSLAGILVAAMGVYFAAHGKGYWWHFALLAALIPAMPLLSYLGARMKASKACSFISKPLEWMGRYSLELYVCHSAIFSYVNNIHLPLRWRLPLFLLAIPLAWLIAQGAKGIRMFLTRIGIA